MLETVFYSLRLFVVGGAMVMVVVGHICKQNIMVMVIHNIAQSSRATNVIVKL